MEIDQKQSYLHKKIWAIAESLRGMVDGWDFKQYVLGTLFFRFMSESFVHYISTQEININYAELNDCQITAEIVDRAIKTKGYFIYPSQVYSNIVKNTANNAHLSTDISKILSDIESSASGYPSEKHIKGLFNDFETTRKRLGKTQRRRTHF